MIQRDHDVLVLFAIGVNVSAAMRYAIDVSSKILMLDVIGFAMEALHQREQLLILLTDNLQFLSYSHSDHIYLNHVITL